MKLIDFIREGKVRKATPDKLMTSSIIKKYL